VRRGARQDGFGLGSRIQAARVRRGFARAALGAACGVSEDRVSDWEAAEPPPSSLERLAEALGVSATALRRGGPEWDSVLLGLQPVSDVQLLLPPTQWPEELSADQSEVYRQKDGDSTPPPLRDLSAPKVDFVSVPVGQVARRTQFVAEARCTRCRRRVAYISIRICDSCTYGD
jgi:transcriptional regulator with XRE-family HTH domain